ncbi:MAG: hypothetical protein E3K37_17035 [Candidatus Kuenenia sp.]|nr:hypothetical protein [Candidatus Kuenenia hertensis]
MSAILELFKDNYSSQKMLNETKQDINNSSIGVENSNTYFANDEIENDEERKHLPFEELLTQHTSPATQKAEEKNTKKSFENPQKTATEKISEGEETECSTVYAHMIDIDNIANIITNALNGNAYPAELKELNNFYNLLTSETAMFSDAEKAKILATLEKLLHLMQSVNKYGKSLDKSIADSVSPDSTKAGNAGENPYYNTTLASKTSGEENKELFGILEPLFKTIPSKNDSVPLESNVLAENKYLSSFTKEGFALQSNVFAENKGFAFSPNKSFFTRSAFLESFVFNTNTQEMSTSANSIITNLTPTSTNEGVVSQLNGLLNNYDSNAALLELSLPNSETREAHKALKSLLQTITNGGKNNAFSSNTSINADNSTSGINGSTINIGTKDSGLQETLLQNAVEENNRIAKQITNDSGNSTGKNNNKGLVSKELAGSSPHDTSNSFQESDDGNSSGNLFHQGKNTFTAANINNQPEKTLTNTISFNNPDFQQNMAESLNSTTTNIISSAGDQKAAVSQLFQNNTTTGSNTMQNNVMEQILENIKTLHHGNRSEIRLQLTPPELGTVKLHFTEENDEVSARIYVENAEVKAAIQNNVHRLRESIAANGVEIHKLEVYVQNENRNEHEQQRSFADFEANDSHYQHSSTRDNNESHNNESNETNHTRLLTKNKTVNSLNLTIDYIL